MQPQNNLILAKHARSNYFFDLICDLQLKCATTKQYVQLSQTLPINRLQYRAGYRNRKLPFLEKVCTNNHRIMCT